MAVRDVLYRYICTPSLYAQNFVEKTFKKTFTDGGNTAKFANFYTRESSGHSAHCMNVHMYTVSEQAVWNVQVA